jgi:hypothetical protein
LNVPCSCATWVALIGELLIGREAPAEQERVAIQVDLDACEPRLIAVELRLRLLKPRAWYGRGSMCASVSLRRTVWPSVKLPAWSTPVT